MKPILFTLGPFHVFAFGLFLSVSFLACSFLIWKYGKEELIEEELMDTYLYTSLFVLASARLFYIIFHFGEFGGNVLKYLVVREAPGLSLIGGLIGGIVFLYYYTKRRKLNFLKSADIFALAFCFGLALVSIGEFLGGATFGSKTTLPWAIRVVGNEGLRHPVEIYSFILFLLLFIILHTLYRKKLHREKTGVLSLIFLFFLSLIIFLLEFLKEAWVYLYNKFTFNQGFFLVLMVVVLIPLVKYLAQNLKKGKK